MMYQYCEQCNLAFTKGKYDKCKNHPVISLNDAGLLHTWSPRVNTPWQELMMVEITRAYSIYKSWPYRWDMVDPYNTGAYENLMNEDDLILGKDSKKSTHCCGTVFSVFMNCWEKYKHKKRNLSTGDLKEMKKHFFVQLGNQRGASKGIDSLKIGTALEGLEEAKFGDFLQMYNVNSNGGHAAIVMGRINTVGRGEINDGLLVFSSNIPTKGIGFDYYNDFATGERLWYLGRVE